jgi:hypothetical protein
MRKHNWLTKYLLSLLILLVSTFTYGQDRLLGNYHNANYGFRVSYNDERKVIKNIPPSPDDGIQVVLSTDMQNSISIVGSTNAEDVEFNLASVKNRIGILEKQVGTIQFVSTGVVKIAGMDVIRSIYIISAVGGEKYIGDKVFLFRTESKKFAGNLIVASLFVDADDYVYYLSEFEKTLWSLQIEK